MNAAQELNSPLVSALREIGFATARGSAGQPNAPIPNAPIMVGWKDLAQAGPKATQEPQADFVLGPIPRGLDPEAGAQAVKQAFDASLGKSAGVCLWFEDALSNRQLTRWRNALWPWLHAGGIVRADPGSSISIELLQGKRVVAGQAEAVGTLFCLRRRDHVLSPSATVTKFDANASGWNGSPGSPGYAHYRWMRRFIAMYPDAKQRSRILDFGSGAGWVGIEAALRSPGAHLALFDPSPEMVRHAEENARSSGLKDFTGRTGFGEDPPFPAQGEAPYDLVLSSGVISFSPDFQSWYDGLARSVAPGGTLVVGDIHRDGKGFLRRRQSKPLLPVRELNARVPAEIKSELEARGFRYLGGSGYQLTWPIPQAQHFSEERLGGILNGPLLLANRIAAKFEKRRRTLSGNFDSWVLEFERPA